MSLNKKIIDPVSGIIQPDNSLKRVTTYLKSTAFTTDSFPLSRFGNVTIKSDSGSATNIWIISLTVLKKTLDTSDLKIDNYENYLMTLSPAQLFDHFSYQKNKYDLIRLNFNIYGTGVDNILKVYVT